MLGQGQGWIGVEGVRAGEGVVWGQGGGEGPWTGVKGEVRRGEERGGGGKGARAGLDVGEGRQRGGGDGVDEGERGVRGVVGGGEEGGGE